MEKCLVNSKEIRNKTVGVILDAAESEQPLLLLKENIKTLLKDLSDQYTMEDSYSIAAIVNDRLQKYGVAEWDSDFFSTDNLNNILIESANNIQKVDLGNDAEQLNNEPQVRKRADAGKEFITNAFGLAHEVSGAFQRKAKQNLFDCLFVNRGSLTTQALGQVPNTTALNNNVRTYQTQLLRDITNYLLEIKSKAEKLKFDDEIDAILRNPEMYDVKNNYTGVLEKLQDIIDTYIKKPLEGNTDALRQTYNESRSLTSLITDKTKANNQLKAFYAVTLLENFDTYMHLVYPSILIKDFNKKTGEDKYQLAGKTAKLMNTWRTSENIVIDKEVSDIVKTAIETSPLYHWGAETPRDEYFLTFQNFQHLVGKINDMVFDSEMWDMPFDMAFEQTKGDLYEILPEEIKGKTFGYLMGVTRKNPQKYMHVVFQILANKSFRRILLDSKGFSHDELDKLYSINKNLFNDPKSIRALTNGQSDINIYSFITQIANSISNVKYLQYYTDYDGTTVVRELFSQEIGNLRRNMQKHIENINDVQYIGNWEVYKKDLKLTAEYDQLNKNRFSGIINFTIPGTDIRVKVSAVTGYVTITNERFIQEASLRKVLPFIDKMLGLNLQKNIDLYNRLVEDPTNVNRVHIASENLVNFASRVLLNQFVAKEVLPKIRKDSRTKAVASIYGKNAPDYNYATGELSFIYPKDVGALYWLAQARADVDGTTTSTQVKNGEGNAYSNQTFSRLLGTFYGQFELQEKNEDSATRNFQLLTNSKLLKGIYTALELREEGGSTTAATDLGVAEMAHSMFVFDFIKGLVPEDRGRYEVTGSDTILVLPSVNSDKSTIGRLKLNMRDNWTLGEVTKPLKEFSNNELRQLIAQELGKFYENSFLNVQNDWQTVEDLIASKYPEFAGKLKKDILHNFKNFNELCRAKGLVPVEVVKEAVREYNLQNRLHPLSLIDQVHYINNKGDLSFNQTFISQLARFKPDSPVFIGAKRVLKNFPTEESFWSQKNREMVRDLIKSGFKVNTTGKAQPELAFLRRNYKKWINKSGDLVLAKYKVGDKMVDVTAVEDLNNKTVELNPLLEQFNYIHFLVSQSWMNLTVGSFIAHPEKTKSSNVMIQEAGRFNAQHKRNNAFTAAVYEFLLGDLKGIPTDYNVAVIEDIHDYQGTITGIVNDIKAFDGATFVHPAVVHLENYSLGGQKAGTTKKQYVHFKDERTGTGGSIKTAGFGMTNDWIRNSPFLQNMMVQMTNHEWLDENGNPLALDITRDWDGRKIAYKDFFFKKGGKLYKINSIKPIPGKPNTYLRTTQEVLIDGCTIPRTIVSEEVHVNTNYGLWQLFGGMNSMEIKNHRLRPSETSVENLVIAMNNVGIKKNWSVKTQDDIWQALKMSDIHYVCTAGAVKSGAANINPATKYNTTEPLDFQKIHMYQAGIQLDKEHQADEADIAMTTQVLSACAAKGYTFETAMKLYNTIRKVTDINMSEYVKAVQENFDEKDKANFQEFLMKSLVKALATSNGDNFAQIVAKNLMNRVKDGETIKFSKANIPLSDNTVYRKVFSTIIVMLNKLGIKQHIPGTLSVLTPSHTLMKLWAGRKYESFENFDKEIEALQVQQPPVYNADDPTTNISNLELGRTYLVTSIVETETLDEEGNPVKELTPVTESELIRTPLEYENLKKRIKEGSVVNVTESLGEGRDLAGFNVRFNNEYQIWDLDSAKALFTLKTIKDSWEGTSDNITNLQDLVLRELGRKIEVTPQNGKEVVNLVGTLLRRQLQRDLNNLSSSVPNKLEQYQEFTASKEDTPEWYQRYTGWVNLALGKQDGLIFRNENGEEIPVNAETFEDIDAMVQNLLLRDSQVKVDGNLVTVDKSTVKTSPYEVIMAKTFATKFGLDEFSNLKQIQDDPDYFIKQYIKNQATQVAPKQYTLEFKRSNGDHIYVLEKKNLIGSGLRKLPGILVSTDESGTTQRLDADNDVMYEITPDTKIYKDRLGNQIIVTEDLGHYIDTLEYDSIKLSDNLSEYPGLVNNICGLLKNSSNKVANEFGKYLVSLGNDVQLVMQNNNEFHDITLENYKQKPTHPIIKEGHAKHTSFLRSLDVIASRTPSQSMQSFMPMRVVAFENADVNTVYVSTYQLLLQGSDYDIDTASISTFDMDGNGLLQLWSPYASLENDAMREASETLPIPTGQKVEIQETDNMEDALALFVKYKDLLNIRAARVWNKETKEYDISTTEVAVTLNLQTPELMKKFGKMLEEIKVVYKPSKGYIPFFTGYINNENFTIQGQDQFNQLFTALKNIADRHNLYLDKITNMSKLSRILNNQSISSMFNIISDPANLTQAQIPLDVVTDPLKSEAGKALDGEEAKFRTPGNFVNMLQGIDDNQTGKKDVGKCATGLKIFFGLTEYYNYVLNRGTAEQQQRLLLGSDHTGHLIGGKIYKTLANVRAINPATIHDLELLDTLAQTSNDTDAALSLSAALSLAVDNAKELCLAKLNASTETISMYLYGIMIGMEFPDIAKLMMSPTGLIFSRVLKGNIFLDKQGSFLATKGFDYFKSFPVREAAKFNKSVDSKQERIPNPWDMFVKYFTNDGTTKRYFKQSDGIYKSIARFAKSELDMETKMEVLNTFRNKYKSTTKEGYEHFNQLMDNIESYVKDLESVDPEVLEDLKTLAEGAEEIGRLGRMYSYNQGIKIRPNEALTQANLIGRAVYDITGKEEDLIDVTKFLYDKNYQEEAINRYEEVKHSFNILEALVTDPQFEGYARVLGAALKCGEQSFKFRSSRALVKPMANLLKYNDETKIINGLENYINDYMRREWLIEKGTKVVIPKGVIVTDSNEKGKPLTQDTPMYLGTDVGEATFKMFMETRVIPDLQRGRIHPNVEHGMIKNNLFIRDLAFDVRTKTISGNPIKLYTLPTNMMPSDPSIVDKYRMEFNKVAGYLYEYEVSEFDNNGNEHIRTEGMSLLDLFTYYTMIAHDWKSSEVSLLPMLDDFQTVGLIDEFHKFQKAVDESGLTLTENNTDLRKVVPYVAPRGNLKNTYYNFVWSKNRETKLNELMRRKSWFEMSEEMNSDAPVVSQFRYVSISPADTSLFKTGKINENEAEIEVSCRQEDEEINGSVVYDKITGEIKDADEKIEKYLPKDKKVPFIKMNGLKTVDKEELQSIINDNMNKC